MTPAMSVMRCLLPSTRMGWACVALVLGASAWIAWGFLDASPTSQAFVGRALASGLIGSCLGVLAIHRHGERSWIVWLAGPGVLGCLVLGWILLLTGAVRFAGH